MNKRVVVAMSGGVDSSVAAHLLVKAGYDAIGLFMRMGDFEEDVNSCDTTKGCCSFADSCDARAVAESLGMPFYVLNFEREFEKIVEYFCAEYNAGKTPNPCIHCNQALKFGKLVDYANALDAGFVATGHYSNIEQLNNRYILKKGADLTKDQSYALAHLNQKQLARALFPLGGLTKDEVRKIAVELNLKTKDKPESQEICFIPDNNYKNFVAKRLGREIKPGVVKDTQGNIVGEHKGIQFFTVGQRKGLRIAMGKPMYVVDIDIDSDEITIGSWADLLKKNLFAERMNWISIEALDKPVKVFAKIRYNHKPVSAIVHPFGEYVRTEFDEPQPAVTPGQAVVFYDSEDEDVVMGGGWIVKETMIENDG